jgi:hypothetical protein
MNARLNWISALYVLHVAHGKGSCRHHMTKRNVTVRLTRQTLRKAKILAARRETPISHLLAEQIQVLVGEEKAWERAESQAQALLDQGFYLGGVIRASRDEWHERRS